MKPFIVWLLFCLFVPLVVAQEDDVAALAKSLHLNAGSKAIMQWERVFQSKRKLKRYKLDSLSQEQRQRLKKYLINHAIDSDQPTIAGV
jgi:hypothetical protein